MSMSPVFQAESREHEAGHRCGILRSLEQLVCSAQRQVLPSRCTASRELAIEEDRLEHQRDHDVARALAFVLCARSRDMEALADFLDVIAENPWRTLRMVEVTHPHGGRA
jgi:hypothetical protein